MTNKLHSQVVEGSRHAIHNLTYPNAANRIAGTGEGSGINPPTSTNLWQVAKQDDDNTLWLLTSVSPLTWEQIMTSASPGFLTDTNESYDNFGANPSTIVVDAAEGQGDTLGWELTGTGTQERYFTVDLANGTDAVAEGNYRTGFLVENGSDRVGIYRLASGTIDIQFVASCLLTNFSSRVELTTPKINQYLNANVASGNFLDVGSNTVPSSVALTGSSGTQSFVEIEAQINQSGTANYNGLLVDVDVNAEGSGDKNIIHAQYGGTTRFRVDKVGTIHGLSSTNDGSTDLINLADSGALTQFRVDSDGNTRIGTGTPGSATGAGDLYVTGKGEFDDLLYADAGIRTTAAIYGSGNDFSVGAADFTSFGFIRWQSTGQTPNTNLICTGNISNAYVFCEYADRAYDFAHSTQTNPTLFIHSANQSTTEWLSLAHDQTYARLLTGTGSLCVGSGTPNNAIGVGDLYVTDTLEVASSLYTAGWHFFSGDNKYTARNGSDYGAIRWRNTAQTLDVISLETGTEGNYLLLCEFADAGYNFSHSLQSNPTLFIHSANQSTDEWLSLAHDQTYARLLTGTGSLCVGSGTPGEATGTGDLYATGKIECDNFAQLDGGARIPYNQPLLIGSSAALHSDFKFNTAQTNAALSLGLEAANMTFLICDRNDLGYNFAHSTQTNPTLFIHSANQSTTEWISAAHDQTYGRLLTGTGSLCVGSGTPASATGAGDLYVTSNLEIGGSCFFGTVNIGLGSLISGGSTIGSIELRNATQNLDGPMLLTGSNSNAWIIAEYGDRAYDFAHALQTNPTLFIHSANQSTTEWISAAHDQTNGVLATGAGGLSLAPASGEVIMPDAGKTVYDITPASDLTATGDISSSTVDANATGVGAALYQDGDGDWREADADALATMPCRALALETGTGTKKILRRGWIRKDAWTWTPGAPVYVSTTTGGLTQAKPSDPGDQVQIVGYAETADILDFNPSSFILEIAAP